MNISLGVTSIVPSSDSDVNNLLESMIKTGDYALYKTKETGRDKVVYG